MKSLSVQTKTIIGFAISLIGCEIVPASLLWNLNYLIPSTIVLMSGIILTVKYGLDMVIGES